MEREGKRQGNNLQECNTNHESHQQNFSSKPKVQRFCSSPINSSNQFESPQEKTWRIPVVVEKIIGELPFPDLRNCRLVNKNWHSVSTKEILKRDCCIIKFQIYKCSISSVSTGATIAELNSVLRIAPDYPEFPCTAFTFNLLNSDLNDRHVQEFFDIQGYRIKSLCLRLTRCRKSLIQKLLLHQAPNIQNLALNNFTIVQDPEPADENRENNDPYFQNQNQYPYHYPISDDPLTLPCLETYNHLANDLEDPSVSTQSISYETLMGSPNLDRVINFWPVDVPIGFWIENMGVFKKVRIKTEAIIFMDLYKFARAAPKLHGLVIDNVDINFSDGDSHLMTHLRGVLRVGRIRISEELFQILDSSKDSLEFLHLSSGCFPGFNIPILSTLKELKLSRGIKMMERRMDRIFPPYLDLDLTFPHLQTLSMSFNCHDEEERWEKFFPSWDPHQGKLRSVTQLQLSGYMPGQWLERLKDLCPRVKRIKIKKNAKLHVSLPRIFTVWEGTGLTSLEIDVPRLFQNFTSLDSVLTGIPESLCAQLRNGMKKEEEIREMLGQHPALPLLTSLKTLNIRHKEPSHREVWCKPWLMTFVSELFAFRLCCSGLRVTVCYDQGHKYSHKIKESLTSIAPYVTVKHLKLS